MARPQLPPQTRLGVELRSRRGAREGKAVAAEVGVAQSTLSHLERGTHRPTYDTAVKLAAWLGWTTDAVMQAASQPAPSVDGPDQQALADDAK